MWLGYGYARPRVIDKLGQCRVRCRQQKMKKRAENLFKGCRHLSSPLLSPTTSHSLCVQPVSGVHVFSTSMQEKSFPSSRNSEFFKTETDEKFTSNCPRFIIRRLRARPNSREGGREWEQEKSILSPYNYSMLCYAKQLASASSVAPNMADVVAINVSPASSATLACSLIWLMLTFS